MTGVYWLAFAQFTLGGVSLLGWLYMTMNLPGATKLLLRSLWLIVVPMLAFQLIPDRVGTILFLTSGAMLLEELVKLNAARREQRALMRFWLVTLFGIWELILSKPIMSLGDRHSMASLERADLLLIASVSLTPVIMHATTAAVYAFRQTNRPWLQLIVCWGIHTAYNFVAILLPYHAWAYAILAAIMALLLFLMWKDQSEERANS